MVIIDINNNTRLQIKITPKILLSELCNYSILF